MFAFPLVLAVAIVPATVSAQGGVALRASITVLPAPAVTVAAAPAGPVGLDAVQVRGAGLCRVRVQVAGEVREAPCESGGIPGAWRTELAQRTASGERIGIRIRVDAGT